MADGDDTLPSVVDQILEISATPIVMLDPDGRIVRFNGACERLTGYTRAEVIDTHVWDFLLPEDEKASVIGIFKQTRSGPYPTSFTNDWLTKTGERRRIRWSNSTLKGPDERVQFILGTGIDITDYEKTNQILADREEFLKSIINTSPVAIITINAKGKILSFSPAAEKIFGYTARETVSEDISMLMPATLAPDHDGHVKRYLKEGEAHIIGKGRQVTAKHRDGSTFPVRLNIGEFQDGEHIFVGFLEDVSKQMEAELQNRDLQSKLEQASRLSALGTVATAIAHELNQPLTAASTLMEAAELHAEKSTSAQAPQIKELLSEAIREVRRSGQIIRNVRDFIRKGKTERQLHDLNEVVQQTCMNAKNEEQRNNVEIKLDLGKNVGKLPFDRIQLQQVIINLVSNAMDAMKSSELRKLTIRTRRRHGKVQIDVIDTGTGLPNALKGRIFEPFITTKAGGLGIGLAICKSIVEAHGGTLTVASNKPQGTAFSILLPVELTEGPDVEPS